MSSRRKDVRELIARAVATGWENLGRRRSGHTRLRWPQTGQKVTIPSTPSDWRSLANVERDMRQLSGPLTSSVRRRGGVRANA